MFAIFNVLCYKCYPSIPVLAALTWNTTEGFLYLQSCLVPCLCYRYIYKIIKYMMH